MRGSPQTDIVHIVPKGLSDQHQSSCFGIPGYLGEGGESGVGIKRPWVRETSVGREKILS